LIDATACKHDCRCYHRRHCRCCRRRRRRRCFTSTSTTQVCSQWNEPERLTRLWMIAETTAAVAGGGDIILALTAPQRKLMADTLMADGPETILHLIYKMEFDPVNAGANKATDRPTLIALIDEFCAKVGGLEQMNVKVAEASRRSYAISIAHELEQRWAAHAGGRMVSDVLDLGHQVVGDQHHPPNPPQ